jgi:prepilin-type N-terminal cleavage/methylation domain-containing protein
MGTHFKQGFTIIETMLVLAITGVLISALLVGIGGTINNQRYKDSVASFKALLQDQYGQVDNVSNERDGNWSCSSSATTLADQTSGTTPGQSDCVLMGRLVTVVNSSITTASVVGFQKATSSSTNDVANIKASYNLGVSSGSIEAATLEWGAQIAWPRSGLDVAPNAVSPAPPSRGISILFVRSPTSDIAYTFTSNTVYAMDAITSTNLTDMMITSATVPGQMQRFVCINPSPGSTGLIGPDSLSVSIGQSASDATGIEARSNQLNTTTGVNTRC